MRRRQRPSLLDDFDDVDAWSAFASDAGHGQLRRSMACTARRSASTSTSTASPATRSRGASCRSTTRPTTSSRSSCVATAPANNLQVKLVDASGDNVWWVTRPNYRSAARLDADQAQEATDRVRLGARPPTRRSRRTRELRDRGQRRQGRRSAAKSCFDELSFRELPRDDAAPPPAARSRVGGHVRRRGRVGRSMAMQPAPGARRRRAVAHARPRARRASSAG